MKCVPICSFTSNHKTRAKVDQPTPFCFAPAEQKDWCPSVSICWSCSCFHNRFLCDRLTFCWFRSSTETLREESKNWNSSSDALTFPRFSFLRSCVTQLDNLVVQFKNFGNFVPYFSCWDLDVRLKTHWIFAEEWIWTQLCCFQVKSGNLVVIAVGYSDALWVTLRMTLSKLSYLATVDADALDLAIILTTTNVG